MIKDKWTLIKTVYRMSKNPKWMPPDLVMYIDNYMEQHPEKKLTWLLERKLKNEYYSELRKKRRK